MKKTTSTSSRLFHTICIWVIVFAALFWLCGFILTNQWLWFTGQIKVNSTDDLLDLVPVVLTIIGGVIAISYLVIKYRERSAQERAEVTDQLQLINRDIRFAIEQLGHSKAVVRIAGVHALVDISDEHGGSYKQRIVDVLCGYLRADRSDTHDRAVESTILQAILYRTRKQDVSDYSDVPTYTRAVMPSQLWCDCSFDFHGATFEETVSLADCTFNGPVNFEQAVFLGFSSFDRTEFYSATNFAFSQFHSPVSFYSTHFISHTRFERSQFLQEAFFRQSIFEGSALFGGAVFHSAATFNETKYNDYVLFKDAEFSGLTTFNAAHFNNWAVFDMCDFQGAIVFDTAKFSMQAVFSSASFRSVASFTECYFEMRPNFHKAAFSRKGNTEMALPPDVSKNGRLPAGATWLQS